jgi:putative glutamine amidotransferase
MKMTKKMTMMIGNPASSQISIPSSFKPTFALISSRQSEKTHGLNNQYVRYFQRFGNVIVIPGNIPNVDFINKIPFDILVLPGGADVDTKRYGEPPVYTTGKPNIDYEWFDTQILPHLLEAGVPTFCRGFQTLNVALGGQLDQDIPQDYSGMDRGKLTDKLVLLNYNSETISARMPVENRGKTKYQVNSIHHQGISGRVNNGKIYFPKKANSLISLAYNHEYNNLEAFQHESLPIVGVQWHPEELVNPEFADLAVQHLISAAYTRQS